MARHLAEINQRNSFCEHALEMLHVRQVIEDIPLPAVMGMAGEDTEYPVVTIQVAEFAE